MTDAGRVSASRRGHRERDRMGLKGSRSALCID